MVDISIISEGGSTLAHGSFHFPGAFNQLSYPSRGIIPAPVFPTDLIALREEAETKQRR